MAKETLPEMLDGMWHFQIAMKTVRPKFGSYRTPDGSAILAQCENHTLEVYHTETLCVSFLNLQDV